MQSIKTFFKRFWCWLSTRHKAAKPTDSFERAKWYECPCGAAWWQGED